MIWRGREEAAPGEGQEPDPGQEHPGANRQPDRPGPDSVGSRVESVLDAAERAAAGIREDAQEWARRYAEEARQKADQVASERIREISGLTDNLISRARAVAQQSDELLAALDEAGRRVIDNARPSRWEGGESAPPVGSPTEAPTEGSARPGPPPMPPPSPQPPPARRQSPPPQTSPPPTQVERPPEGRAPAAAPPTQPPAPPAPAKPPPVQGGRVSEGARLLATQMAVAGSTRDEIAWRLREEFAIQDVSAILDEIGI